MMPDAFIYDHVRTPRGKGRASGALHTVTPIELASTALRAIRDRNALDTSKVDDVVLGCVAPIGEQGADIARVAVINSDYDETVAGVRRLTVSLDEGKVLDDLLRALIGAGVRVRLCDRVEADLEEAFSRILEAEDSEA